LHEKWHFESFESLSADFSRTLWQYMQTATSCMKRLQFPNVANGQNTPQLHYKKAFSTSTIFMTL